MSISDSAPDRDAPDYVLDTEWSPKLAYPVFMSLFGLIGIGAGVVSLTSGAATLSSVVLLVAGAILLLIGFDQFRRTPRLQLLPDGLIYYGLRGRRFIERELVEEVRLMHGRRRGVASLIRIEYLRDPADAARQRDRDAAAGPAPADYESPATPPVDGELLLLSRTEVGGNPREVADVLSRAGYKVVDASA